jgi:nucleoside-diphosphate kinase
MLEQFFIPLHFQLKPKEMAGNRTLTIIKPDAVRAGNAGNVIAKIQSGGYQIKAMRLMQLSRQQAEAFYEIHRERPFFGELVEFMTSGPVVPMVLEKTNAVEEFRNFIGATNPAQSAEGTIRKLYGTNVGENAIHGSDSDENAQRESRFFFAECEEV